MKIKIGNLKTNLPDQPLYEFQDPRFQIMTSSQQNFLDFEFPCDVEHLDIKINLKTRHLWKSVKKLISFFVLDFTPWRPALRIFCDNFL